ncbi:MAG TPA: hypothetical protein VH394_10040 [Thermoanaerobaculia bacterium]|jgi:hypothetical protein|nr:hypothetical protein [Thermoanaerobaculia bacterium]
MDEPRSPQEDPGDSELAARLSEAGSDELLALVREHLARLDPPAVKAVLRNPYATAGIVEEIASQPRLLSFYEVRRDIAMHPRTPEILAQRLVPGLYWRDLSALGADTRLHPRLRRAADQMLVARLPELAVGEKVTMARRAGPGLLAHLRHDPSPRVIGAMLDNPRLTEDILAPVAHSATAPGPVLALIAADRRWGVRYGLQVAICRNPRTPLATVLRLLPLLRKSELKAVVSDPRLAEAVRQRARLLLGEI